MVGLPDRGFNVPSLPRAPQILADLGADVVKVEPPDGDPVRRWGPPFVDGESPLFLCGNRGKRSIVLDLDTAAGRDVLRRLIARCDVFVQAFRAGVVERLGFDYDTVRDLRPGVIYVSVTAFGTEGPLRDQPGYDPLMQAFAGIMSVTGHPGGPPTRAGTSTVDMGTGLWAGVAVLAELVGRGWNVGGSPGSRGKPGRPESPGGPGDPGSTGRSGGGTPGARPDAESVHITMSLLDTSLAWMAYHLQGCLATRAVPGPLGSGLGMIAPYQAFPAADGEVMIAAANDGLFRRLCEALGLPELVDDPRFTGNADRVAHREALVGILAERTRRRAPADDLLAQLRDAGVPCAPIHDAAGVVEDEQVAASGMLRPLDALPGYVDVAMPVRRNGERLSAAGVPPRVGEHTAEVLAELEEA
ncbi:MAG: CaiB/BaiF CoA transferase family protein [Candidatus Longimicrobiales bacterium M2_2A_002]